MLESLERSTNGVQALLTANEAGRRLEEATIQRKREESDNIEERVRKLRSMLATLSRQM